MIKRAQIRFICITMSILLTVFTVMFMATYLIMRKANEYAIERTLEKTSNNFFFLGDEMMQKNGLVILYTITPTDEVKQMKSFRDSDVFTENDAVYILNNAINKPYSSGRIDNVYYSLKEMDSAKGVYLLVATDETDSIATFRKDTINSFLLFTTVYVVLFYIVYRLSFRVFTPIKEAFHKQKQFISDASHELKTPLTIISANTDVLRSENNNQWLDNIHSQTARMDSLVADMLTLAKMDEGKNKLLTENFNLSDEITSTILPFDALAFEKGKILNIDIQPDVHYVGDASSVKKIVNILLDNAIKHADNVGKIDIAFKKESGRIALTVFNTGSNVPTADSNKIFERFYRGDQSRSRESGGSGLGLSIAKSIADANKWKIYAFSIPGQSMKITLVF